MRVADNFEVRDICEVHVAENRDISLVMLFDAGRGLEERVLATSNSPPEGAPGETGLCTIS